MTKANLKVGMMVVTENGKVRLVLPTKNDGLVLVSADNKMLKVDKMNDDLTRNRYKAGNDVVKVYDIMDDANGKLFSKTGRDLLFDRATGEDNVADDNADDFVDDDYEDDEEYYDECCDCEDCTCSDFTKANITPGMLAVTRDGQNRLAIPTSDKGLVLATSDSKFICVDKLNDDLTITGYRSDGKNVDKVYGIASGVTTDFYSTDNRALLFDRDAE